MTVRDLGLSNALKVSETARAMAQPTFQVAGLLNAVEALRGSQSLHLDLTRLLGGATNQVIQSWRSQIAADHKAAPQFVAEAMSRVIGDSNLSFVTARDLGALAGGEGSRRGIEEAVASYTAGIGTLIHEARSTTKWAKWAALLAAGSLIATILTLLLALDVRAEELQSMAAQSSEGSISTHLPALMSQVPRAQVLIGLALLP